MQLDISPIEEQARETSWNRLQKDLNIFKITRVKEKTIVVIVEGADNQRNIIMKLPLINQDGEDGFDLGAIIQITMKKYKLNPEFGIQVNYWSK